MSSEYLLYLLNIYFVDQVCWTQAATSQLARRRTRQHGITLVVRSDDSDKNIQWEKYLCVYKNISHCYTRKLTVVDKLDNWTLLESLLQYIGTSGRRRW